MLVDAEHDGQTADISGKKLLKIYIRHENPYGKLDIRNNEKEILSLYIVIVSDFSKSPMRFRARVHKSQNLEI